MMPLAVRTPGSTLADHFGLKLPAVVNVVGAGGKSGLILSLVDRFSESMPVLYTTTTRILYPPPESGTCVIAADDCAILHRLAVAGGRAFRHRRFRLVAAGLSQRAGYLSGVDADFADGEIREAFPLVFNEADGARGMSLKFPRDGEPVLMKGARYLIAVIGLDCLGQAAGPRSVFRWELLPPGIKSREGEPLNSKLASEILLHPLGVCKDWHHDSIIIVYVNKVDAPDLDPVAAALARILLKNQHFPIERVVCGSLRFPRSSTFMAFSS